MATSKIEEHMMGRTGDIRFVSHSQKFSLFGDLSVPRVEATNDFDYMVGIVEKMLLVVGAVFPSEVIDILNEAKSRYIIKTVDDRKICSSSHFVIPPRGENGSLSSPSSVDKNIRKDAVEHSVRVLSAGESDDDGIQLDFEANALRYAKTEEQSDEDYQKLFHLKYQYLKLIVDKWDTFIPAIQSVMSRNLNSNLQCAMLNFDHSLVSMYEFLCIVYDEALESGNDDVVAEVMQLAKFYADYYPSYGGFYDLLGVSHYNRNEYEEAIESWNTAKRCILDPEGTVEEKEAAAKDHLGYGEKIDSLLISANLKKALQKACGFAETNPEEGLTLLKSIQYAFSDWWVFNYYMGVASQNVGRMQDAMTYYTKTLELHSGCHQALERMSELYTEWEDYEKAYMMLEQSLSMNPLNGEAIGMFILASEKVGKLEQGKKLLPTATELSPSNYYVLKAVELCDKK